MNKIPATARTVISERGTLFWPQSVETKLDGTPDARCSPRQANGVEIFVTHDGEVSVYRHGVAEYHSLGTRK